MTTCLLLALRQTISLSCFVAFVGIPGAYWAYTETVRSFELRKRRKRYDERLARRREKQTASIQVVGEEVVDQEERKAIEELYGVLTIGGRYCNPFLEWREQVGLLDLLVWKLVWQPFTGRIGWNGGIPKNEAELAALLPVETPNWKLLFGKDESAPPTLGSGSVTPPPTMTATGGETPPSLSSSWDHLSQPSDNSEKQSIPFASSVKVSNATTCTWLGQSCNFVQLEQVSILTDPIFSYATSHSFNLSVTQTHSHSLSIEPYSEKTINVPFAPRRLHPVPCPLTSLLSIQLVLISHNHLDHTNPDDVVALGDSVQWIVPTGMRGYLTKLGVSENRITELSWWEETEVVVEVGEEGERREKKLSVTAVPAMHWSARTPFDTNQSLWCSYVVQGERTSYFHCGDTGYCDVFKQIGKLFGPITLATLPIGAYLPRWHLRSVHLSPDDAVQVALDIGALHSVGVHHSTWVLSDEHFLDPPKDLEIAKVKYGYEREFICVPPGRTLAWDV